MSNTTQKISKYKVGGVVMIYLDPLNCINKEGNAELMEFKGRSGGLECWAVSFADSPGFVYNRYIKA